jgi:hypothetical protein
MLSLKKSQEKDNSFGSLSSLAGNGRALAPSSIRQELANQSKLPRAAVEDLGIKKALMAPATPAAEVGDWDKMVESFSILKKPIIETPISEPIAEVTGQKVMISEASTNSFSSVDENFIDQLSGSLGNLNKTKNAYSVQNLNSTGNESTKDQVYRDPNKGHRNSSITRRVKTGKTKETKTRNLIVKTLSRTTKIKDRCEN